MLLLLLLLGAVSVASLLYFHIKKRYDYWKAKGVPQCKGLSMKQWRLSLTLDHVTTRNQWIYNQYPEAKYVGFYQMGKPYLMIKDVDLIKRITVKDFDHFVNRQFPFDTSSDPLWNRNLVILEGEKWKDARNLLSPSFTANKIKRLLVFMRECTQDYVNFLTEKGDTIYDMNDMMSRYTTDVIATAAYGIKANSMRNRENQFYVEGQRAVVFDLRRIVKIVLYGTVPGIYRLLKLPFFPQSVLDFFRGITEEIVQTREEKNIVRPDVIHLLMEARKSLNGTKNVDLTIDDIAAHAFLYFLAGFDTVSSSLSFLFYELAVHQDVQDKLRREIDETSKRHGEGITYEALTQMDYMDMVVTESLRKWTPMPQVTRRCVKPYTLEPAMPGGEPVKIEKGTVLTLPLLNLHRDPKLFSDPDKFYPERFISDESKDERSAFMAFGSGPRNCIGSRFAMMELKVFIYHVLGAFKVEPVERTPIMAVINPKAFSVKPLGKMPLLLKKIRNNE